MFGGGSQSVRPEMSATSSKSNLGSQVSTSSDFRSLFGGSAISSATQQLPNPLVFSSASSFTTFSSGSHVSEASGGNVGKPSLQSLTNAPPLFGSLSSAANSKSNTDCAAASNPVISSNNMRSVFGGGLPNSASLFGGIQSTSTAGSLFGSKQTFSAPLATTSVVSASSSSTELFGRTSAPLFENGKKSVSFGSQPEDSATAKSESNRNSHQTSHFSLSSSVFGTSPVTSVSSTISSAASSVRPAAPFSSGEQTARTTGFLSGKSSVFGAPSAAKYRPSSGNHLFSRPSAQTKTAERSTAALNRHVFGSRLSEGGPHATQVSVTSQFPATSSAGDDVSKPPGTTPFSAGGSVQPVFSARSPTSSSLSTARPDENIDSSNAPSTKAATPDHVKSLTALLCKDVPEPCNDRRILMRHFSKFGTVVRLVCNRPKMSASVQFSDHAAAELAKRRGARVHPKMAPMSLFWRQSGSRRTAARLPATSVNSAASTWPPSATSDHVLDELSSMRAPDESAEAVGFSAHRSSRRTTSSVADSSSTSSYSLRPATANTTNAVVSNVASQQSVIATATLSSSAISELRAIIARPAVSVTERYRVLDARDRLMREAVRQNGGCGDGPLVGTCPDMCPEKERYMREEKHQISATFERSQQQCQFEMDHRLAVKQYSRSSADQEQPLLHELRSPAALTRTMDYLVVHVMDTLADDDAVGSDRGVDAADWYLFLWDRTRSLRKDITQQQLTEPTAAQLVEKCARFHVHCAARLSQLPIDVFDQKINNENLTKCLQTLKHLYDDLSMRGEQCDNEAEFRAYEILLNLNRGDILREVQTYSPAVRCSERVRHAVKLHTALSANNYVRFFKLYRRADYLQSCLLQRYLSQMRTRALDVITRAVCPPKRLVKYPLDELLRILAIEDERECCRLLRLHNLECGEGVAYLERALFQPPEAVPPLPAAPSLIANKRTLSVGQTVNGGDLPCDPLIGYIPLSSFGDDNILRTTELSVKTFAGSAGSSADSSEKQQQHRAVQFVYDQLVWETVETLCRQLSADVRMSASVQRDLAAQLFIETQTAVLPSLIRCVCEQTLELLCQMHEEQLHMAKLKRQQEQLIKEVAMKQVASAIVDEVCLHLLQSDCTQIYNHLRQTAYNNALASVCEVFCEDLVTSETLHLCQLTASSVLQSAWLLHKTQIEAASNFNTRRILRRYWSVWRHFVRHERQVNHQLRQFPAISGLHSPRSTLKLLAAEDDDDDDADGGGGFRDSRLCSRLMADTAADVSLCHALLTDRVAHHTISVATLLASTAVSASASTVMFAHSLAGVNGTARSGDIFWKLCVLQPREPCHCSLSSWLTCKLTDAGYGNDRILQQSSVRLRDGRHVHLVVCSASLSQLLAGDRIWRGVSGVLAAHSCRCFGARTWRSSIASLRPAVVEMLNAVPVVVLCPAGSVAETERWWEVCGQSDSPHCSPEQRCRITSIDELDPVASSNLLMDSIGWLFNTRLDRTGVVGRGLCDLAGQFVDVHVLQPLNEQKLRRRTKRRVEISPDVMVTLYNSAIQHLSNALAGAHLSDIWWPSDELAEYGSPPKETVSLPPSHWNSERRLMKIKQMVERVYLPEIEWSQRVSALSWSQCCEFVYQYARSVSVQHDMSSFGLLHRLRCVLCTHTETKRSSDSAVVNQHGLGAQYLPWTDIISCCIEFKLSALPVGERVFVEQQSLSCSLPLPSQWLLACSSSAICDSESIDGCHVSSKRLIEISSEDGDDHDTVKTSCVKRRFQRERQDDRCGVEETLLSSEWQTQLQRMIEDGRADLAEFVSLSGDSMNGTEGGGGICDSNGVNSAVCVSDGMPSIVHDSNKYLAQLEAIVLAGESCGK